MQVKYDFIYDDFDKSYKVFGKADNGQNLLLGKFVFVDEPDYKWEMEFMQWLCSHVRHSELSND